MQELARRAGRRGGAPASTRRRQLPRAGRGRAGQGRAGQGRAGQGRAGRRNCLAAEPRPARPRRLIPRHTAQWQGAVRAPAVGGDHAVAHAHEARQPLARLLQSGAQLRRRARGVRGVRSEARWAMVGEGPAGGSGRRCTPGPSTHPSTHGRGAPPAGGSKPSSSTPQAGRRRGVEQQAAPLRRHALRRTLRSPACRPPTPASSRSRLRHC